MAALTKERDTTEIMQDAKFLYLPVKGSTTIYQGAPSWPWTPTATRSPGKKATGLTAAGRAEETVENKGADGEAFIRVARGVFVFNNTATTSNKIGAAHVLKPCYIEDDQTVTALATGASAAGLVVRVDEDGVAVEIGRGVTVTSAS